MTLDLTLLEGCPYTCCLFEFGFRSVLRCKRETKMQLAARVMIPVPSPVALSSVR
jgi:hypothetical protein